MSMAALRTSLPEVFGKHSIRDTPLLLPSRFANPLRPASQDLTRGCRASPSTTVARQPFKPITEPRGPRRRQFWAKGLPTSVSGPAPRPHSQLNQVACYANETRRMCCSSESEWMIGLFTANSQIRGRIEASIQNGQALDCNRSHDRNSGRRGDTRRQWRKSCCSGSRPFPGREPGDNDNDNTRSTYGRSDEFGGNAVGGSCFLSHNFGRGAQYPGSGVGRVWQTNADQVQYALDYHSRLPGSYAAATSWRSDQPSFSAAAVGRRGC